MSFKSTLLIAVWALWAGIAQATLPIQSFTTSSGARVFLVESPSLPMVDVQIDFDAGARRDPAQKTGLANQVASMTAKGVRAQGSLPALDENQLGEAWADLGASFGGRASDDRMSFKLRSLTQAELLRQAVQLAARQLAHPAYRPEQWEEVRARDIASLKEARTRPATLAQERFMAALYPDHPYGRKVTEDSLRAISVEDMGHFHQQHLWACRAKVSIVGAVTRQQAQDLVQQLLAHLSTARTCPALPGVPEAQPLQQAQNIQVPFEAAQSQILLGQPSFKRTDPDFFALLVGNHILGGGGFVSRLTHQVREQRGLSYSVYSYFAPGLHAGPFVAGLQTRPDQAQQALQLTREIVRDFVQSGPTAEELRAAQDNLVGGFALRLDSNRKLLDNLANIAWFDLPLNYLDHWTRRIEAVTIQDIRSAFGRKLQPDRMVSLILGPT
ncbi:MAG: pitrilysin family protein [Alphaproteobacteria bacterium]|nr:pitrilysin family protein [Alphaproteobacteria bacterium]